MNKNIIEGRRGGTSWHNTAKSSGSALEVNGAAVSGSNAFLPGEIRVRKRTRKSAEVVLVRRETGGWKMPV
jgi:hypothetical protein